MIAKILDISVQEVKEIEASAIRKMKTPTEQNKKLREYLRLNLRPREEIEI